MFADLAATMQIDKYSIFLTATRYSFLFYIKGFNLANCIYFNFLEIEHGLLMTDESIIVSNN